MLIFIVPHVGLKIPFTNVINYFNTGRGGTTTAYLAAARRGDDKRRKLSRRLVPIPIFL